MTAISKNFKRGAAGAVFGGVLFTAGLGVAGAEPVSPTPAPAADGLVTVTQGGATLLDGVPVMEAASTITQLCGSAVPDANGLVSQVDTQGASQVACAGLPVGDVVVAQNVAGTDSPVIPGTSAEVSGEPAAPMPPGNPGSAAGDLNGAGAAEPPAPHGDTGLGGQQSVDDEDE
ncbi:hypothetical protein [Mycolicibacterium mengxianglii]|uniref:hypothetical protein n=1 Tax=Mycolicibacterium mengxianglii TaxID=2736649 RepID=UPI0018D1718A|nr:hypothetical protein [Mycolicibacterium mengxianglii]